MTLWPPKDLSSPTLFFFSSHWFLFFLLQNLLWNNKYTHTHNSKKKKNTGRGFLRSMHRLYMKKKDRIFLLVRLSRTPDLIEVLKLLNAGYTPPHCCWLVCYNVCVCVYHRTLSLSLLYFASGGKSSKNSMFIVQNCYSVPFRFSCCWGSICSRQCCCWQTPHTHTHEQFNIPKFTRSHTITTPRRIRFYVLCTCDSLFTATLQSVNSPRRRQRRRRRSR